MRIFKSLSINYNFGRSFIVIYFNYSITFFKSLKDSA